MAGNDERERRGKPIFHHGQWIRALDSSGTFNAQPDLYLHFKSRIILFEFKLTRCQSAERQLLELYGPLLYHIFHLPLVFVSVFLNPGPSFTPHENSPENFEDVLRLKEWEFYEWHLRL